MAKKTNNPADAFRKAQRAKEVKKNKEVRKKVRDSQNVKKDTRSLENELASLKGKKDDESKARLAEVEKEIKYINQAKEAYVKAHPDERDKVFGRPRLPGQTGGNAEEGETESKKDERLYDEQGKLKDPTRSFYYDPVYNPWGVPPPGMPYRVRDHVPEPSDSESDSDEDDSDDDIVMPEGPPPEADSENDSDDSDDIPLPDGPPPTKGPPANAPTGPRGPQMPPLPPMPPPIHGNMPFQAPMPPPPFYAGGPPPYPPPIPGQGMGVGMHGRPMPPFARPPPQQDMGWGAHYAEGAAGPSAHGRPPFRPPHRGRGGYRGGPPRAAPVLHDPLSDGPTQTYQGRQMARAAAAATNLPVRPGGPPDGAISAGPSRPVAATAASGAGEISAAPQLRDLRKEATAFVPRNIKKKQAAQAGSGVGRINSAPNAGMVDEEGDERVVRREESGLMSHLKAVLGPMPGKAQAGASAGSGGGSDDDYQKFLDGLGNLDS